MIHINSIKDKIRLMGKSVQVEISNSVLLYIYLIHPSGEMRIKIEFTIFTKKSYVYSYER